MNVRLQHPVSISGVVTGVVGNVELVVGREAGQGQERIVGWATVVKERKSGRAARREWIHRSFCLCILHLEFTVAVTQASHPGSPARVSRLFAVCASPSSIRAVPSKPSAISFVDLLPQANCVAAARHTPTRCAVAARLATQASAIPTIQLILIYLSNFSMFLNHFDS